MKPYITCAKLTLKFNSGRVGGAEMGLLKSYSLFSEERLGSFGELTDSEDELLTFNCQFSLMLSIMYKGWLSEEAVGFVS